MLYHPGDFSAYAIGSMKDVAEWAIPADYHWGVAAYTNAPMGARLSELTAKGLSRALDRSYPTHTGGNWEALEVGLSDEELVVLGENAVWALPVSRVHI